MRIALTREVSPSIGSCELTHLAREAIDLEIARAQHREYERALADAGCMVQRVTPAPEFPDAMFVEDIAVVFEELAVITRPGAPLRRAESPAIEAALELHRPLARIEAPGTLDGGDVLVAGRRVFVGRSGRTNAAGIAQLRVLLGAPGYTVHPVGVRGCLHLKTAATAIGDELLLANPQWVDVNELCDLRVLHVDPAEPFGANALRVEDELIYSRAFPRTRQRLERSGLQVRTVQASELAKAEGGVTCCSLVFTS